MNLRRDLPSTRGDVERLTGRYDLALSLLGLAVASVRLARAVSRAQSR